MFFLNLSAGEFLAMFGALGALVTALYLLDRTKRKKVVSTLRFWPAAVVSEEHSKRKRVREPWSLVLQLASLLLLLLAIAQLQWGSRERRARDYVLLLDASAWTGEQTTRGTVIDGEKSIAREFLRRLPPQDRVMLVEVDALSKLLTPFTSDHRSVLGALSAINPGFSALNIQQAISFAQQALMWSGGKTGEIVYVGPELVSGPDPTIPHLSNLRALLVPASREDAGIRSLEVRRADEDPNGWQAAVSIKNYGTRPRVERLLTSFAGTAFAPRTFTIHPGEEIAAEYRFTTNTGGRLSAEIQPGDTLSADDRAELVLSASGVLRIAVYTNRPELLAPLLEANHRIRAKFFRTEEYTPAAAADLIVLDEMTVPRPPSIPTLWINPPHEGAPLPITGMATDAQVVNWANDGLLAEGLHARETRIPAAEIFQTFEGDLTVASVAEGPVVVASPGTASRAKRAVIGFDPIAGQLKFEVTTPLLFANLLRWLEPDAFRTVDFTATRVGTASVLLDRSESADGIRVVTETRSPVPFTVHNQTLELFSARPAVVHISSGDRERVLSLTLPDIAQFEWKPPAEAAARSIDPVHAFAGSSTDLWEALAVLGGGGLFLEWMLFGRRQGLARRARIRTKTPAAAEHEHELIAK